MLNRRDLLKFLGIGTVIIPVIDGMPKPEAAAELIALPEVKHVALATPKDMCDMVANRKKILVSVKLIDSNEVLTFKADSFVTSVRFDAPVDELLTWEIKGRVTGKPCVIRQQV